MECPGASMLTQEPKLAYVGIKSVLLMADTVITDASADAGDLKQLDVASFPADTIILIFASLTRLCTIRLTSSHRGPLRLKLTIDGRSGCFSF